MVEPSDELDPSMDPTAAFEHRRRLWLARCPCPIPGPPSPTFSASDELSPTFDGPDTSVGSGSNGLQLSLGMHSPPSIPDGFEPLGPAMATPTNGHGVMAPANGQGERRRPSTVRAMTSPPDTRHRAPSSPPVPCSEALHRSPAFGPMALLQSALESNSREAELAADAVVSKLAAGNKLKTRVKLGLIVSCFYSVWQRDGTIPPDYVLGETVEEQPLAEIEVADARGPTSSSFASPMPPGTPQPQHAVVR